jgi:hypothetical protein
MIEVELYGAEKEFLVGDREISEHDPHQPFNYR